MTEKQVETESHQVDAHSGMMMRVMLIGVAVLLLATWLNWKSLQWFQLAWLIGTTAVFFIRGYHVRRMNVSMIADDRNQGFESLSMIIGMTVLQILPLGYLLLPTFVSFADYDMPIWGSLLGIAILPLSLWLLWRGHADLGANYSAMLEIHEDHRLVTDGIYIHMRHPIIAATLLLSVAQALLLHNWIAGFLVAPIMALRCLTVIPREESMLEEHFGEKYRKFKSETFKIFPGI